MLERVGALIDSEYPRCHRCEIPLHKRVYSDWTFWYCSMHGADWMM
jgi:hypothetical protein